MFAPAPNWKSVLAAFVIILAFGYSEDCKEDQHQCVEDGSCISLYDLCDFKPNCANGSDESYTVCKTSDPENEATHCANGALLSEGMLCNNIVDCLDGTDELPQVCDLDFIPDWHGNCPNKTQIECLPGECVSVLKMCNGLIDCSNGRDESLEVCLGTCVDCFRCGNGVEIEENQLCDNFTHCLDGTDELLNVCMDRPNWARIEPKTCAEPLDLKFTNNTKFTMRHTKRFVYPNQPAEVECWNSNRTMWNVCMNDGRWHHDFPSCIHKRINTNPDTNGSKGCPINYYNKKTMLIKAVDSEEESEVLPPFKGKRVIFKCDTGYDFLPYKLGDNPITCLANKTWIEDDFHPRCVKLCKPEEINGIYSFTPTCFNGETGIRVQCTDAKSLIPGTIVKFECYPGFTHRTSDLISVVCSENGTWTGLRELCEKQEEICTFDCTSSTQSALPYMKDGEATRSLHASWVVPIYIRNTNTTYFEAKCVGNLIRFDIVLTAAHCIDKLQPADVLVGPTGNRSASITPKEGFPVRSLSIDTTYNSHYHNHDVGLIFLEERMKFQQEQSIVCLAYEDASISALDGRQPQVTAWSSDGILSTVYGSVSEPQIANGDFLLTLNDDYKVCQGDSGSGVIIPCLRGQKCLVGVISRIEGPGTALTRCHSNVTAASILSLFPKDFITQNIRPNMNCPVY